MLKKDFLEQIKEIEDDKDIDEIILNNGFAKPLKDIDGFNELLASNKEIQGFVDSKVTQGIDSFKKKGMQKLIEAEVLKRTGKDETPEQKQIRELQERLDKADKEKARAEMVSKFKDKLTDKKIPSKLIDFVLGEDEDSTNANIEIFENTMKSYVDSQVQERLNGGYKPPKEEQNLNNTNYESLLKNENLTLEEAMYFFANENKE